MTTQELRARRSGQSMRFSEAESPWQDVPSWARYLIKCGFALADGGARRRIGIVSMPCESAGAGLVALGAIRYRLTLPEANDGRTHFERIQRLAARRLGQTYLRHKSWRGRFRLEAKDSAGLVWVRQGPTRFAILARNANDWRLEQEAPAATVDGVGLPHRRIYEELIDGVALPLDVNLSRSDSAICLAGRAAGESASRSAFSTIQLGCPEAVADLATLLTVHRWSPDTVSRLVFFNARTGCLDRNVGLTSLVVADGDSAFLRAVDAPEFKDSDVVGILHRTIDRHRLESIGARLAGLSQWYVPDGEMLAGISPPAGITVSVFQRRDV